VIPPHLPDLIPCDFFLFSKMKLCLKECRFDMIEEIHAELQEVILRTSRVAWNHGKYAGITVYMPKGTTLKEMVETRSCGKKLFFEVKFPKFLCSTTYLFDLQDSLCVCIHKCVCVCVLCVWSNSSVAGVGTRLCAGTLRYCGSIVAAKCPHWLWGIATLLLYVSLGVFFWGLMVGSWTTNLHLVMGLRMCGAIHPLLYLVMACTRQLYSYTRVLTLKFKMYFS
jgi:hypothetical protein